VDCSRFAINIHQVLTHQENEKRVELLPPDSVAMDSAFGAVSTTTRLWPRWRCTPAWHAAQNVIKFSSVSAPEWLRNSLWCTSRFDIVPQDSHLQPSRFRTSWRKLSYAAESSRKRAPLGESSSGRLLAQVVEENLPLFAG